MKFTYLSTIVCLFLTTTVLAEMDYFIAPGPNRQYKVGDTVSFVVEDMPDEEDQNVNANLHKSDGSFVKTIQTWSSQAVDESGEEFPFQWQVDVDEGGEYYVEIRVGSNRDDATQSHPFTVEVDGESPVESDTATDATAADAAAADPQSPAAPDAVPEAYDQESQEQPDEPEEKEEPAKNKLSLHNTQSKVAHISSHNDIDTVSDPSPADNQKPKEEVKQETSSKLAKVAAAVTSKLPVGHKDNIGPANLDISKLAVGSPKGKTEPLMPQTKPHASMKDLVAADDVAIEQEKKWIAEQKKGSSSNTSDKGASSHADKGKPATSHSPKGKQQHKVPKGKQPQQKPHQGKGHEKTQPPPKVEAKKVTADDAKKPGSLTDQIKAKAKETVDLVKQHAQEASQRDKDQKELTLAQQEALDDAAAKKELESIKKSQAAGDKSKPSSKEKRDAYRQIIRNRAKFAKQSL